MTRKLSYTVSAVAIVSSHSLGVGSLVIHPDFAHASTISLTFPSYGWFEWNVLESSTKMFEETLGSRFEFAIGVDLL